MASILLVYATGEGQTAKITERIAGVLADRGHATATWDVAGDPPGEAVTDADAVLVGASIHICGHEDAIAAFVERHHEALAERPTGFFQVSLSAAVDDEARRAEAAGYIESFLEATGWQPDRIASFGGALRYSKYGFLKRLMMQRIAAEATGDTDTARDYEYTDWTAVEAFANEFGAFLEARLRPTPEG